MPMSTQECHDIRLTFLIAGPFAGLLLADYGASVLRIDRAPSSTNIVGPSGMTRHKSSIYIDLKNPRSRDLLLSILLQADVLIDPFRPGVLERRGLSPTDVLLKLNPRLIIARMTGFRRDGKYKDMAGHDINYIAVSGVLSMLGRSGETPYAPGNILGDFAGGGAMCFMGILLALISRQTTGKGQVVEANMVDGSAYLATMPRVALETPTWDGPRGTNLLDGGCPWYDTYETKDEGKYFAVGALEPHFYAVLLNGLGFKESDVPDRDEKEHWPAIRELFTQRFKEKTRSEWEAVFNGSDACATPVLEQAELARLGFEQRLPVGLVSTPGKSFAREEADNGEGRLKDWFGWTRGQEFEEQNGVLVAGSKPSKL
jgi:alpha-methylacyl-CoA racemase